MNTLQKAETRSLSIAASPASVHAYVADAHNLPGWAPAFATAVRPAGERWVATTAGGEVDILVRAQPDSSTVDIVSAEDQTRGLFTRVLPNADGSELLFTLLFPPETPESAIAAQMATIDEELAAVRDACQ